LRTRIDSHHLTRAHFSLDLRLLLSTFIFCRKLPFPSPIPQNHTHRKRDVRRADRAAADTRAVLRAE
jgi:hypothetical protein